MNIETITTDGEKTIQYTKAGEYWVVLFNSSVDLTLDIRAEGVTVYVRGLYISSDARSFTLKTNQHHAVGNSVSDLLVKSVLSGESKLLYEGFIRIDPGAQLSNAYQKNQNILLSRDAFVDSRPFLEIQANDVRCTHGSTTGRLDQQAILFAGMRGITPDDARRLVIEGFVTTVFEQIPKESVSTIHENIAKEIQSL